MLKCSRVVLVGPYPPPYGGVSVHIQRLKRLLEEKDIPCEVHCDRDDAKEKLVKQPERSRSWLLKYLFVKPGAILHFHTPVWVHWLLIGFLWLCGRKAILTIHSINTPQDQWEMLSSLKKTSLLFFMRRIPQIIAAGSVVKDLLVSFGINPEKIIVIPAFLPPVRSQADFARISTPTWKFIAEHHPVVSACAFQLGFYHGQEIYGVDMCVELCMELKKYYPRIGFVCVLSEVGDTAYFKKIQKEIKRKNIENNFYFVFGPCEFYPLLFKSDLFVRPTCTDSYGMSIAEAIHFGVPAVASNVCERPKGAVLFEARNQADFLKKVREVLANPQAYRKPLGTAIENGPFEKLLELYDQFGLQAS